MRDLINIIESVGLANRKPGSIFTNGQGDQLIFTSLDFYPDPGEYPDAQALETAIDQQAENIGIVTDDIVWTNDARGARAFALAHFVDQDNQDYYFGRYFKTINPTRTANRFPNSLPGGYNLVTGAAVKERSGYKPSEILTQLDDLSPNDILQQTIAKFGADSDEAQAMTAFMQNDDFPMTLPKGAMNFAAFTNYFCELLQPMALVMGKATKGNASEAEQRFLSQGGYQDCVISFGSGATQGLVDSMLSNSAGQAVGLSSKAKAGAKASAANLASKIAEMKNDPQGQKILERYKDEVAYLETIAKKGYINGPLTLAVKFGIIDAAQADTVRSLKNLGPQNIIGTATLDKDLEAIYQSRRSADPQRVVPFYHMLAAIAHQVADHINNKTDFGRAASDILNFGAFVQAYTNARQQGNNIVLEAFTVRYPSQAVTSVLLRAEKTYYSTGNKGNFTFEILLNGAKASDVPVDLARTDTEPDVDLDAVLQQPRLTGPGAKAARTRQEPSMSPTVLGRGRR